MQRGRESVSKGANSPSVVPIVARNSSKVAIDLSLVDLLEQAIGRDDADQAAKIL
jgi:hypothetical protein